MTPLLVAEELFLLTHDDETGKGSQAYLAPDAVMAGALLLDLAERGVLTVGEKNEVHVTGDSTGIALLDDVRNVIADSDKTRTVTHWFYYVTRKIDSITDRVGDMLVERGVLEKETTKKLKFFTSTRWPEHDPVPEQQLREGLQAVLLEGAQPTPHQAMVISLLHRQGLIPSLVDKDDRKAAKAAAETIADEAAAGKMIEATVADGVAAMQAAVMVSIMTPTIIAANN